MEKLYTLNEVSRLLPSRPNLSTVWRWCLRGVGGIKLDARRFGRQWLVSEEALQDFSRKLAEASRERLDKPRPPKQKPRQCSARRAKAIEQAKADLKREGVLS
jgi:hypothetical protein